MVGVAFLLVFATNIILMLFYKEFFVINVITPDLENVVTYKWDVTIYSLIPILVVNSVFEESIVIGYLFKRLENISAIIVISVSVLIRQLCHLYQGPLTFFYIIPMGLVFALYYWRYRRLTPLIIAHGLGNMFTYLGYIHHISH
jgi:membrane protease YdiL (CAAX protease family)